MSAAYNIHLDAELAVYIASVAGCGDVCPEKKWEHRRPNCVNKSWSQSQYNLRAKAHNNELISKTKELNHRDYLVRMLYRNIYWLQKCIAYDSVTFISNVIIIYYAVHCRTSNFFRYKLFKIIFYYIFNCILFHDYCVLPLCVHGCAWQLLIKKSDDDDDLRTS